MPTARKKKATTSKTASRKTVAAARSTKSEAATAAAAAEKTPRRQARGKPAAGKAAQAKTAARATAQPKAAARTTAKAKAPARTTAPGKARSRTTGTRDPLAVYKSMRDFGRTPEPQGQGTSKWKKDRNPFFVIQKHAATRLHYDFRLEVDGVLKSWAVPKGPSMNPADKRLAVETEDHPVDYADFEGVIPPKEYGGGTVIVWDAGPYRNIKKRGGQEIGMQDAYERGSIEVWLEGRKVRGGFALVHSRMGDNAKNWLLIKMRDECASAHEDPVTEQARSVMTGRTLEEVAADPKRRVWSSK
ncbi:MAG TPA: DNA polymerase ligase N-terminal domain-containing protein [Candidatus Limnocylindrales bacterium]|nr:DNA polymerase ligase N-terminal domain-containing protein [Candidatus Limnocylindrales bacterium]